MFDQPPDAVSALLGARRPGHTLPGGLYTGAEAFAADLDVVFGRHWIAVGVEADVPEAGDACAVDVGRSSIAIVRGGDGIVRAFHNVCSHRGARLLDAGRHSVGRLVCPYHQWTYDLAGGLAHAPHMGTDLDAGLHHLRPVHLRSVGGLLYACLADEAPADVEDLATTMAPRLAPYDLAGAKVAFEAELVEEGNWKLTMENNRECYHCGANHPELCVSFVALDFGFDPATLTPEDLAEAREHEALYAARGAAWEADGFPSALVDHTVGHATNFRTQRLVIAGAGESQTPDARAACRKLLGTMTRKDAGDVHLWGINAWTHVMGDHAVVSMIFPLAPDRTLVRTKWLVHRDAVEGEDYDLGTLTAVWRATNAQDAALVARAHAGVASVGYRPGPYSRFTEAALDDFCTWYVERMAAHGLGAAPAPAVARPEGPRPEAPHGVVPAGDGPVPAVDAANVRRITFAKSGRGFDCASGQTILQAARAAGVPMRWSCGEGHCGTCKTRKLAGSVSMAHAGGVLPREVEAGMILPCCSRPDTDVVLDR